MECAMRMEDTCPALAEQGQSPLCRLGRNHKTALSLCPLSSKLGRTALSLIVILWLKMKRLKESLSVVPDTH